MNGVLQKKPRSDGEAAKDAAVQLGTRTREQVETSG